MRRMGALLGSVLIVLATTHTAGAFPVSVGPHRPIPVVLDRSQLQGPCDLTFDVGDVCAFWYGNGDFAIGDANWGFLNLDTRGTEPGTPCGAGSVSSRADYLRHGYPSRLRTRDPAAVFVCSETGDATVNWDDLVALLDRHVVSAFPVNDCGRQVDADGQLLTCGSGTPAEFAVVGFAPFRLVKVLRGDDPAAIGTPGVPGGPSATPGYCGIRQADPTAICLVTKVARWRYQPDAAIAPRHHGYVGRGVDELHGTTQVVRRSRDAGSTALFRVSLDNAGSHGDTFRVHGGSGTDGFTVRYSYLGADATRSVTGGEWWTPPLATGEHAVLEIRITPRPGATPGARCAVVITARSVHDRGQVDAVRAVVTTP